MTKEFPNGVYPVMLTPFTENNEVDYEALGKLVDWYIEKGMVYLQTVSPVKCFFYHWRNV